MIKASWRQVLAVVCSAAVLSACSSLDRMRDDSRVNYRNVKPGRALEVPPDLTQAPSDEALNVPSESASASMAEFGKKDAAPTAAATSGASGGVLSHPDNVRIQRDGNRYWLVMQGDPDQVWPLVRNYWANSGFSLVKENPQTGIIETDWAEKRPHIDLGGIKGVLAKYLGSKYVTGTRDKFRVRLEQGLQPGTTEIHLTHSGLIERTHGGGSDVVTTYWEERPADPDLEAEMLRSMMLALGVSEAKATEVAAQGKQAVAPKSASKSTPAREEKVAETAKLVEMDGAPAITLGEDLESSWRKVGDALDQGNFSVSDRNRSEGVYYLRYDSGATAKKSGFMARIFRKNKKIKGDTLYRVKVAGQGTASVVTVLDEDGKVDDSAAADQILKLLVEQLN